MTIQELLTSKKINFKEASGGRELNIACPWCGGGEKHDNNFFVNATTGNFMCFRASCDVKGNFKNLLEKLELPLDTPVILSEDKPEEWNEVAPIDESVVEEYHQRLLKMLPTDQGLQEYLHKKRGYTIDTIKKFKIGWGDKRNLVVPIYSGGVCVNFKMKSDPTIPGGSKGMYSISGRGKKRLFNAQVLQAKTKKDTERIIICEGEWDCMLLDQYGYSAVTSTGGALSFDESWIPMFTKFDKIYVCLDNDTNNAGQKGVKKIADQFMKHGLRVFIVRLPNPTVLEGKVDVTDFFTKRKKIKADFTQLLKDAQEYSGTDLAFEKYRFIDGATLDEMEFPANEWIVDRFIQDAGITCIAGPGGVGKSFFTTYLAACISQGLPVLDRFPTKEGNILFIDKENALSWTQNRLRKFHIPKESMQRIFFMSQGDFMIENKEAVEQVEVCIQAHNIKLVVIDTLVKIHSGDEISATDINKISQVFWRFQQLGAAVLFVHHYVKASAQFPITNPVSALRGSSHIYNMVDNYFGYRIDKGILRLDMAKARNDQLMKPFKIDCYISETDIDYQYIGDITDEEEESYKRASCKESIKSFIVPAKRRQEIIDKFHGIFVERTIDRTLKEMKLLGEVETQANGKEIIYSLSVKSHKEYADEQLSHF